MSSAPVFAVVGHPNKGKSSVVATLSRNDTIAIALEPGTTRRHHAYPMSVDGQVLYTLVDTPGFQRPRRVLQWLQAHSLDATDRPQTVQAFVLQHRDDPRFQDECELLTPIIEGAGIIYVVDGSVPYSPEHEAEMTILRWTGRPSLALINSIGDDDYSATWQTALGQFFQIVRKFDAVRAPFEQHLSLLRAFGQLEPDWQAPLELATRLLSEHRLRQQHQAATLIADTLEQMMRYRIRKTLAASAAQPEQEHLQQQLQSQWTGYQRQQEQSLRRRIERLYLHRRLHHQSEELSWQPGTDLFSEDSRRTWSVSRQYLATAGFGAGAIGGAGIDALTLGSSLGTAALVGGLIGAAGSYFWGDRLRLPSLHIGPLRHGLRTLTYGPVQDLQFGYVVLGRAVDHWWHVSHRNHARQDLLTLPPADHHWLERLDKPARQAIHRALDRARRRRPLEPRLRAALISAIEAAMAGYEDWRLNRS